jgi:hypothetical protein
MTYVPEGIPAGAYLKYENRVVAKFYSRQDAANVADLLNVKPDILNLLYRLKIHNRTGPLADDVTALIDKLEAL